MNVIKKVKDLYYEIIKHFRKILKKTLEEGKTLYVHKLAEYCEILIKIFQKYCHITESNLQIQCIKIPMAFFTEREKQF
jgi:hypothetical protein